MNNINYLFYHILFGALFVVLICLKCDINRFLGSLNLIVGPTNLERLNKTIVEERNFWSGESILSACLPDTSVSWWKWQEISVPTRKRNWKEIFKQSWRKTMDLYLLGKWGVGRNYDFFYLCAQWWAVGSSCRTGNVKGKPKRTRSIITWFKSPTLPCSHVLIMDWRPLTRNTRVWPQKSSALSSAPSTSSFLLNPYLYGLRIFVERDSPKQQLIK